MTRRLLIILGIGAVLVFLACIGAVPPPVIFAFHLLIGWIGFLTRVVPLMHVNGAGAASAIVCLAGVLLLGHAMARWFWRDGGLAARHGTPWKLKWTAAGVAVIVLLFVAGIGATGVTHQSVWLAKSDRPMFMSWGNQNAQRFRCASNMRVIGEAIQLYADQHAGQLPDSLKTLFLSGDLIPETFVCPASNEDKAEGTTKEEQARHLRDGHCSYVYHGRGLTMPIDADRPILCEPLWNHDGEGMNILFGDMHVEWCTPTEARQIMESLSLRAAARGGSPRTP
jgi:hypothetical protein